MIGPAGSLWQGTADYPGRVLAIGEFLTTRPPGRMNVGVVIFGLAAR